MNTALDQIILVRIDGDVFSQLRALLIMRLTARRIIRLGFFLCPFVGISLVHAGTPFAYYNPNSGEITFKHLDTLNDAWRASVSIESQDGNLIVENALPIGLLYSLNPSQKLEWWISSDAGTEFESVAYAGEIVVPETDVSDLSMKLTIGTEGSCTIRGCELPSAVTLPAPIHLIPEPCAAVILTIAAFHCLLARFPKS